MKIGKVIIVDGETVKEGFAVDAVTHIGDLIEDLGHYSIGMLLGLMIGLEKLLIVKGGYFVELFLVLG